MDDRIGRDEYMIVRADDITAVKNAIRSKDLLLLDFDGPICSVFAGHSAADVAEHLIESIDLRSLEHLRISKPWQDPLEILQFAMTRSRKLAEHVETQLTEQECHAVKHAEPTPGSVQLMRTWLSTGGQVGIVSNNSTDAIRLYLENHRIGDLISIISARTHTNFHKLKPSPHLIQRAYMNAGSSSAQCVMIGDSPSDFEASRAADVSIIGFANKPAKIARYAHMELDALVTSITVVAHLVESSA
ncbi:HAD family hydrolase [Actinokineospora sp.]|uniref:HAD family hydrolase n=1 Tax=Actinokineospora sp. TaxID=1872133 RepID=UPI003D6C4EC9